MRASLRCAPLLLLVLAGCGGGGGFSRSTNPYAGEYAGTFTETTSGTVPSGSGFAPPTSGIATATVTNAGALTVDVGTNYYLAGTVDSLGAVSNGHLLYRSGTSGTDTTPSATITFNKVSGVLTITANATIGTTATASYTVTLTLSD